MRWIIFFFGVAILLLACDASANYLSIQTEKDGPVGYLETGTEYLVHGSFSYPGQEDRIWVEVTVYFGDLCLGIREASVEILEGKGSFVLALKAPEQAGTLSFHLVGPGFRIRRDIPVTTDARLLGPGELIRYNREFIQLRGEAPLPLSRHFLIRKEGKGFLSFDQLFVGAKGVSLWIVEGQVVEIVLPPQVLPLIRVALTTQDFRGMFHERIQIGSGAEYFLLCGETKRQVTIRSHETLTITPIPKGGSSASYGNSGLVSFGELVVFPTEGQKLTVKSLTRGVPHAFHPAYAGSLEVWSYEDGLVLVNALPLEEYLLGVVPSEMISSWHKEALKAQAVASRTYGVAAILEGNSTAYGFHLLDSVYSQVYNNRSPAERTSEAVRETRDLVLTTKDQGLVTAYYHSTSIGQTNESFEVWHGSDLNIPGFTLPYLSRSSTLVSGELLDLCKEEDARGFLLDWTKAAYDSISPWYRWKLTLKGEELRRILENTLPILRQNQPDFVQEEPKGQELGAILDLRVVQRGFGGGIMALEIVTDRQTIRVIKELNIRYLLRPSSLYSKGDPIVLHRFDGSTVRDLSVLPSASFTWNITRNPRGEILLLELLGGGMGHGIGMSQWAAFGMAQEGYSFGHILTHFFQDVMVQDVGVVVP